jgi:Holliday junction DNA helicase RuvA
VIAQLRGTLVEKSFDRVVVEVGGVGYAVIVSLQTLAELPQPGHNVLLRTHLQVRDDAHVLYGFATDEERRAFELCIGVSGIGPKLAMAMLSSLRPDELAAAIRDNDVARLQRTPGVGRRTAERVVLELKDRLDRLGIEGAAAPTASPSGAPLAGSAATVSSALVNLGYRAPEADRAAREAARGREHHPIEQILKEALRLLTT